MRQVIPFFKLGHANVYFLLIAAATSVHVYIHVHACTPVADPSEVAKLKVMALVMVAPVNSMRKTTGFPSVSL